MPLPNLLAGFLALQGLGPAVERPDDGHGYRISDAEVTLDQALELAALAGGTLLVLESAAEESWVRGTFGVERFWLGLEYPRERWANGAPVEYLHWAEGEPGFGDRETFTVMGWERDSGAWNDVSGGGDRFRAVVETEKSAATRDARLPRPEPFAGRCALVLVVEGLTLADVEDERNLGLNGLWRAGARAMAAADPSGDALASWGLVAQGVGQAKTDLVDGGKAPPTNWFPTLIERLEEVRPEITTGWILDEPELSRMVASGGKMNLRVAQSGASRTKALEDLLGGEGALCAFVGYTLLRTKPDQRARALQLVDAELRLLLERIEQRGRSSEDWLVVLAGTPPLSAAPAEASAKRKKDAPFEVARVPLALRGKAFETGPWHGTLGLADVVPTVAAHFGVRPGAGWALDGRARIARPVELDRNLLENGGAEAQRTRRSQRGPVPGWTSDGTMGLGVYQAKRFELDAPGPATRGANHFQGSKTPRAELEQRVDVRALAAEIDAKKLTAELSGWLGGLADGDERAELELACLAENEKELELFTLGPVGSAERRKELGATKGVPVSGLVSRSLSAELPKGTRTLRVRLRMQGQKSCERTAADELSLVLHAR